MACPKASFTQLNPTELNLTKNPQTYPKPPTHFPLSLGAEVR